MGDDKDKWDKEEKGGVKFDVLKDSDKKKYNCGDYTDAKLSGKSPDSCGSEDHSVSVDKLKKKLDKDPKYTAHKNDDSKCGCGKGKSKNCAVMYYNKEDEAGFHWAAFDSKRCDWGGKLSSSGKIVRFKNPGDYIKRFDKEEQKKTGMIFYCKDEDPPYISDEDLHDGAKNCKDKKESKDGQNSTGCLVMAAIIIAASVGLFLFI